MLPCGSEVKGLILTLFPLTLFKEKEVEALFGVGPMPKSLGHLIAYYLIAVLGSTK